MKTLFSTMLRPASIIACCLLISACSTQKTSDNHRSIPISWTSDFTLPDLLKKPIKIDKKSDISKLISSPWYYTFKMKNTKHGLANFSSCYDYFTQTTSHTRPQKESEMPAYLELKSMCDAARILMTATNALQSYLPKAPLDKSTPNFWPKEIASQISTKEAKRTLKDTSLKTWSDITHINSYHSKSVNQATYRYTGGYQEINILGRGDVNHDGIQDLIISSRDYTDEGDYFNMRIFVLSMDKQHHWHLITD